VAVPRSGRACVTPPWLAPMPQLWDVHGRLAAQLVAAARGGDAVGPVAGSEALEIQTLVDTTLIAMRSGYPVVLPRIGGASELGL